MSKTLEYQELPLDQIHEDPTQPRRAKEFILAVGIDGDHSKQEELFLIPAEEFRTGDYRILASKDHSFSLASYQDDALKNKVLSFVKQNNNNNRA